jgi:sugar phosphate isomerase/epimerase
MKFAFMSFSCPELSLVQLLDLARQLGYDGVEPRVECKHGHGIELGLSAAGRKTARALAAEKGVAFACVATSCSYADPHRRTQMVDDTRRYIDLAADIGAARIRVFGGAIPAGIGREPAVEGVAGALASVAAHAASRGVSVCLETHDHWCDPADVAAVMRRAAHPAIQVNWDIMHPVHVAHVTMQQAFTALQPWIRHVHFHDGAEKGGQYGLVPIGQGDIDHATAVRLLTAAGWDGYMSGEWIDWEPYAVHLPRELATMKGFTA